MRRRPRLRTRSHANTSLEKGCVTQHPRVGPCTQLGATPLHAGPLLRSGVRPGRQTSVEARSGQFGDARRRTVDQDRHVAIRRHVRHVCCTRTRPRASGQKYSAVALNGKRGKPIHRSRARAGRQPLLRTASRLRPGPHHGRNGPFQSSQRRRHRTAGTILETEITTRPHCNPPDKHATDEPSSIQGCPKIIRQPRPCI